MSDIDPDSAVKALSDIARVERRAIEATHYGDAAASYFLWSALTTFGYLYCHFDVETGRAIWLFLNIAGVLGTAALGFRSRFRRRSRDQRVGERRPMFLQAAALAFGSFWYLLLTHGGGGYRESATYFPTIFMFVLVVVGFWLGRIFIYVGVAVTALVLAVYLWSGPWFDYLMAISVGGTLAAAGFWFRHLDTDA